MKLFAVDNLTSTSLSISEPWKFKAPSPVPDEVRKTKHARQAWYQDKSTVHNFYTGIEPSNPNIRLSKDNPPRLIHAFVADYDIPATDEAINRAIENMDLRPTWVEKSLGGNFRLVWMLQKPIAVDYPGYAEFILSEAFDWLPLDELPGLDEKAFKDPARLYANGLAWRSTAQGTLSETRVHSFLFKISETFRWIDGCNTSVAIPLDVIEPELKKKYPNFEWPTDFAINSQGPSFWVAGSTSPLSAIIREKGIQTFSAHAEKPFYTWTDLLGAEFTKNFQEKAIDKATNGTYWDGKAFWRKGPDGIHFPCSKDELVNHFKVNCGLSEKREGGVSIIDRALQFIYDMQRVEGGAPFVFLPPGFLELEDGRKVINTYSSKVIKPLDRPVKWGPDGEMPFLSRWFDEMFDEENKINILAWMKCVYEAALYNRPHPGQNIFLMGAAGSGKTLFAVLIMAPLCGGIADAGAYLIRGSAFNSQLFDAPIWLVDDDVPSGSEQHKSFETRYKKMAASEQHECHQKFCVPVMVEWAGRVIVLSNLDYVSSRILGPMDNTSRDKISIFRIKEGASFPFQSREHTEANIKAELAALARYLVDMEFDPRIKLDARYRIESFHDKSMMDQSAQTGRASVFKEVLIEALATHFRRNPEVKEWRGSVSQLFRFLADPTLIVYNDPVIRTLKIENVNRHLEQLQREGCLNCEAIAGPNNVRLWVFPRFDSLEKEVEGV